MTDIVDRDTRSRMMSAIGSKNTSPELILRKLLHRLGFRFRLHSHKLPGRPDIVLPKYKLVVFVHGCFWHRHEGCRFASTPASNIKFWNDKFQKNIERDIRVKKSLTETGWRHLTVWECRIKALTAADKLPMQLSRWIRSDRKTGQLPVRRRNR